MILSSILWYHPRWVPQIEFLFSFLSGTRSTVAAGARAGASTLGLAHVEEIYTARSCSTLDAGPLKLCQCMHSPHPAPSRDGFAEVTAIEQDMIAIRVRLDGAA